MFVSGRIFADRAGRLHSRPETYDRYPWSRPLQRDLRQREIDRARARSGLIN